MHDIEPFHKWRHSYIASEDDRSPFYQREYNEFSFTNKIYNYFIHPQWDFFGSQTLYTKILFADYDEGFAILEFIGEWNDCLNNDIMYLKRELIDHLIKCDIYRFVLICENVLNFHGSDDSYYEEWYEDVVEESGWICYVNVQDHVKNEMESTFIQQYAHFGHHLNELNWRAQKPAVLIKSIEKRMFETPKQLNF